MEDDDIVLEENIDIQHLKKQLGVKHDEAKEVKYIFANGSVISAMSSKEVLRGKSYERAVEKDGL